MRVETGRKRVREEEYNEGIQNLQRGGREECNEGVGLLRLGHEEFEEEIRWLRGVEDENKVEIRLLREKVGEVMNKQH